MDFERGVAIGRYRLDPIQLSVLFTAAVSLIFLLAPQIDIWFTGLFYDPAIGFPAKSIPLLRALRALNTVVVVVVVVTLVVNLMMKLAIPDQPPLIRPQVSLFLLSTLIVAPGIVVNGLFKSFSGRPRPISVDLFGGDKPFVEVWHFTRVCARNCSFVGGEASSALWAMAIWLVAPPPVRRATFGLAVAYVVAISLNRIAFGAHFLSDVLVSWGLTALIIAVAHRYLIEAPPAGLTDERQDALLTRIGLAFRGAVGAMLAPFRRSGQ